MKGGNPRNDIALLVLRVGLGSIMMYYGSQKLMGAFGGPGPKPTIDFMQNTWGIPMPFAICAMCAEFFGGLGLVLGLVTPLAAFGVMCVMGVATYVNWRAPGTIDGALHGKLDDASKLFYTVTILLGAFALTLMGAGKYSLDSRLFKSKGRK